MKPNVNPETGVRYGIIAAQELDDDLAQDLCYGPQAKDVYWQMAVEEVRQQVLAEVEDPEADCELEIDRRIEDLANGWICEEPVFEGELDGVKYRTTWLGGAMLVWIFASPVVGRYEVCSPCVPNAGNLDKPDEDGVECYDVPPDWRNGMSRTKH